MFRLYYALVENSMNIQITGNHLPVTEPLEERIKSQLSILEERSYDVINVEVLLSCTNDKVNNKKAEITVKSKGKDLFASDVSEDMYKSIDAVAQKIITQLQKRKEKINSKKGHSSVKDLEIDEV